MKKGYLLTGFCALTVMAALLTGCSSSSGGDDTDYLAQFEGTWQSKTTFARGLTGTETDTDTLVISAAGTYSLITVEFTDYTGTTFDSYSTDAETGTVSATADTITYKPLKSYYSQTNMTSIPTTGGTDESGSQTISYLIKDGKLYFDVYTRQGSGTGIIGTWVQESSASEVLEGSTLITDTTNTMTITDSKITDDEASKLYLKGNPDTAYPSKNTDTYSYTVKNSATITVTETGTYSPTTKDWTYEIAGDKLILTTGAYTKQ